MFHWIDLTVLWSKKNEYQQSFSSATPFKSLIIENFISHKKASELASIFPDMTWEGWNNRSHEHQYLKQSCTDVSLIPEPLRTLIYELNSGPFLNLLSEITGIKELLPDPNLIGGGLHMTRPGGTLTPHIDFHVVKGLSLYRRLNFLVYLNQEWESGNGGELELWNKKTDKIEKIVPPTLGTAVLFQTDDDSPHGFTNPVAGKNRQSIAMYYYTAQDADVYSGDGATYWRSDSAAKSPAGRTRLLLQRWLLFLARVCSSLSWRFHTLASLTSKRD
jgi:hypothetical protein